MVCRSLAIKGVFWAFVFQAFLVSCGKEDSKEQEIKAIPVQLEWNRFDRVFARATPDSLSGLKAAYPFFFPEQYPDSVWVNRMQDTIQRELFEEVEKVFADTGELQEEIHGLFQHFKYYFPQDSLPAVYTLTTDVDYRNRVVFADTILLVGLDNYLGPEHRFYEGIQQYVKDGFRPAQIPVHIAQEMIAPHISGITDRSFISQLIYYGKLHAAVSAMLPQRDEADILDYTGQQWQWASDNEEYIWRYFVERELLYSNDRKLRDRFLDPAPFSKFYLELDNESPGRLGQYIGLRIVQSYMQNNEVSLQEMLERPAIEIFQKANYKPRK